MTYNLLMPEEKEKFTKVFFRRVVILKDFLLSGIKVMILKPYWKDKIIVNIFLFSAFLNIFLWIFLFQNQKESDYPVILHYNLFFGVDYLGNYNEVFIIPVVGVVVIFVNSILGHFLYRRERLASYFLSFNMIVVQIFLLLAGYLIVRINS
jgi:hypothetical protein